MTRPPYIASLVIAVFPVARGLRPPTVQVRHPQCPARHVPMNNPQVKGQTDAANRQVNRIGQTVTEVTKATSPIQVVAYGRFPESR